MKKELVALSLCVAALSILGAVMLYSTVLTDIEMARFRAQLHWLGLALACAPLVAWLDYGWLQRPFVLHTLGMTCVILLIAVFIPGVGVETNGANRWLRGLGQPSEFAKPVVIILLAAWFARLDQNAILELRRGFLIPLLIGGLPALLIFAEPDWGTAILLGMLTIVMLFIVGAPLSRLSIAALIAAVALVILVAHNPIRLERFLVFLDPEAHRHGAGWQIWHSLLAIGSGGFWGRFLTGSLHKYGFVPEQQTDFIFSRIGEETGLWGTSLVLLLYAGILLCGLRIVRQGRDRFGQLLAVGCTMVIVLQAGINIAVATSMVPNKGLPLPFISYGGSSMLASFICMGLLGSVARHSRERLAESLRPSGHECEKNPLPALKAHFY